MLVAKTKERLAELLVVPLLNEGCEIADLIVSHYKARSTVRILIYSRSGATLDECARISRIAGDLIDGTDMFENGYTLEVSSTGLDRPLKTAMDFRYRVGEKVRLRLLNQKERPVATIVGTDGDSVQFENDDGRFSIPLTEVEEAKIIF